MTLMPVSKASTFTFCSVKVGGGAVDGLAAAWRSTGPRSSTGSPMTFRMRPSTSLPTGIVMGAPVFFTAMPRDQAVGGVHGDAADGVLAQVLRHLEDQVVLAVVDAGVGHRERGVDLRQRRRAGTRRRRRGR